MTIIKRSTKGAPLSCIEYDNNLDATLNRSNHTGTQLASTISDLFTAVEAFSFITELQECCEELRNRAVEISASDISDLYETISLYDFIQDLQLCCEELARRIDNLEADLFEEGGQLFNLLAALEARLMLLINENTRLININTTAIAVVNTEIDNLESSLLTLESSLLTKAPINNPNFTGTVTAPTPNSSGSGQQVVTLNYLNTVTSSSIPIGVVLPYVGYSPPSSLWKIADGSPLQVAAYPALAALLGAQNLGQFNLPDLRNRFPIGFGGGYPMFNIGGYGGSSTKALSLANMAPHSHNLSHSHSAFQSGHNHNVRDVGHTHSVYAWSSGVDDNNVVDSFGKGDVAFSGEINANKSYIVNNAAGVFLVGHSSSSIVQEDQTPPVIVNPYYANTDILGSSQPFDIMPPYTCLNYIIKVL